MQVPLFPQLSQSDTKSRCILSFQGLGLSFEARDLQGVCTDPFVFTFRGKAFRFARSQGPARTV